MKIPKSDTVEMTEEIGEDGSPENDANSGLTSA